MGERTHKRPGAKTVLDVFREMAAEGRARFEGARFPMVQYQHDPAKFVREVLGEHPMPHQSEIMAAVAEDSNCQIAVRSGQKIGKTKTAIWLMLWFMSCFPSARVFATATTAEQIANVIWKELKETLKAHGSKFGVLPRNPALGLHSSWGGEIIGITTRTIEAMAGRSAANMFFIADEASSLEQTMAEAIIGNAVGGARIFWISNPTRAEGPFYDAFFSKKQFWKTYHHSSELIARKKHSVPGVATMKRIEQWKKEYGEDSPFYIVRVKGDFLLDEQAKIVNLHLITEAQKRWEGAPEVGPLSVGCDPAGDKGEGDEFVFSIVRGCKLLAQFAFRGLSEDAAIEQALGFIRQYRKNADEKPDLKIDSDGPIGSAFYGRMRALSLHNEIHKPGERFDVYGVRGSNPAKRAPTLYERTRDELWAGLAEWMRLGAIPPDHKLEQELYAPGFGVTVTGKRQATRKDVLREKLGRSPDRADSLAIAVWSPSPWVTDEFHGLKVEEVNVGPGADVDNDGGNEGFDPYGGGSSGRGGGFSPYG